MKHARWAVWSGVGFLAVFVFFLTYESPKVESRHGRVVDADGKPVAGAYVQMSVTWSTLGNRKVGPRATVRTGPDGAFTVAARWMDSFGGDAPPYGYRVDLEACRGDLAPAAHEGRPHEEKEDVRMALGARPDARALSPWGGLLTWDAGIMKECRLEVSYR